MQSCDDLRGLFYRVMINDKFGDMTEEARETMVQAILQIDAAPTLEKKALQGVTPEQQAYLEVLRATPSNELMEMAQKTASLNAQAREASETKAKQEREAAARAEKENALFKKWARREYWTPHEAVSLALGFYPNERASDVGRSDEFDELADILRRAIKTGRLQNEIVPADFLAWIQGIQIAIPAGLTAAVAELQPAPPKPQEPSLSASSFSVEGYDCPPEIGVMLEAIKQFWVDVDRSKPPKGDGEIIPWIRRRVDSDQKAKAIDLLIRPEWARAGGNKKQSKG